MISEQHTKRYCRDDVSKIENYDKAIADTTNVWVIHHRLEFTIDGQFAHSTEELKRHGMYYHRPYFELIFLTRSEHQRLHTKGLNRAPFTPEHKKNLSRAKSGENHPLYGTHPSEDTRKRISEGAKRRWAKERANKENTNA